MPQRTLQPIANPDVILVGGGLSSALIALKLAFDNADLSIVILERNERPLGAQFWSYHETDLPESARSWMHRLVVRRWDDQDIIFPELRRRLSTAYCSISSDSVRAALQSCDNIRIYPKTAVVGLRGETVQLADGEMLSAPLVIDARGHRETPHFVLAYQKFLGLTLHVSGGHGIVTPVIMDASVKQIDGFRFIYLLPQDPYRILVEDTRYSDHPNLNLASMRSGIYHYAAEKGWTVDGEDHSEQGVLPIALAHDAKAMWNSFEKGAVPVGMRAGLFHATTGYSLPIAVQVAELIASSPSLTSAAIFDSVRDFVLRHWRRQWFFRYLNRMLFRGCPPERRWFVMQRFYAFNEGLIERFYADDLFWRDRFRILWGKPPIPVIEGFRWFPELNPQLYKAPSPT